VLNKSKKKQSQHQHTLHHTCTYRNFKFRRRKPLWSRCWCWGGRRRRRGFCDAVSGAAIWSWCFHLWPFFQCLCAQWRYGFVCQQVRVFSIGNFLTTCQGARRQQSEKKKYKDPRFFSSPFISFFFWCALIQSWQGGIRVCSKAVVRARLVLALLLLQVV
jgi:hypothetical protein